MVFVDVPIFVVDVPTFVDLPSVVDLLTWGCADLVLKCLLFFVFSWVFCCNCISKALFDVDFVVLMIRKF